MKWNGSFESNGESERAKKTQEIKTKYILRHYRPPRHFDIVIVVVVVVVAANATASSHWSILPVRFSVRQFVRNSGIAKQRQTEEEKKKFDSFMILLLCSNLYVVVNACNYILYNTASHDHTQREKENEMEWNELENATCQR